jgi:glycosyltransferase involved in cell wall biosynthesis
MRITIVIGPFYPIPPVLGGAVEKVQLLLAQCYQAAGHEVTIVSRKYGKFPNEELVNGIRYIRINSTNRTSSLSLNLALDFLYALGASRGMPPSDITVTNSFSLPLLLRRRTAGKIYMHVARFPKGQMFLYSRADRIQAVSQAVGDAITRQAPKLSSKVITIGNAIPLTYFHSDFQQKQKIILFVGRIAREKGVHVLLRGFASLLKQGDLRNIGEWKLRIVGPNDVVRGGDGIAYHRELTRLASSLGSACEIVGPIFDEEALIREYRTASIFVYPSLAEVGEALPLAPLEAMAAACAVVVSNLQCFDDYIEDGRSALKFEHKCPNPEENLAAKLSYLIKDPQLAKELAKNGNIAARRFEATAIADKMLRDFESLVAGH